MFLPDYILCFDVLANLCIFMFLWLTRSYIFMFLISYMKSMDLFTKSYWKCYVNRPIIIIQHNPACSWLVGGGGCITACHGWTFWDISLSEIYRDISYCLPFYIGLSWLYGQLKTGNIRQAYITNQSKAEVLPRSISIQVKNYTELRSSRQHARIQQRLSFNERTHTSGGRTHSVTNWTDT